MVTQVVSTCSCYLLFLHFWLEWGPVPWLQPTCFPPMEALTFRAEPLVGVGVATVTVAAAAAGVVGVLGFFLFSFRSSITTGNGGDRLAGSSARHDKPALNRTGVLTRTRTHIIARGM